MLPLPISCFIIAKNEEARIGRAISSVCHWVDEVVVVVDASSTDGTHDIARKLGARVTVNAWRGYGMQKRFAEDLCHNRWRLNLDADENITPALAEEIRGLFASGPPAAAGYRIFIVEVLSFQDEPDRWAHGLWQIRLYDGHKCRFSDSPVHDTVRPGTTDRIVSLKRHIAHQSNPSLSYAVSKFNRYTDAQVADLRMRRRRFSRLRLLSEFPFAFLKAYFVRRFFLRGLWGWSSAIDFAYFRHMRIAKAYEAELLEKAEKMRETRSGRPVKPKS
jgi:glycosyltransferase involved in cell wall biosynthesis